jgi:hypothetical protein
MAIYLVTDMKGVTGYDEGNPPFHTVLAAFKKFEDAARYAIEYVNNLDGLLSYDVGGNLTNELDLLCTMMDQSYRNIIVAHMELR